MAASFLAHLYATTQLTNGQFCWGIACRYRTRADAPSDQCNWSLVWLCMSTGISMALSHAAAWLCE
eukprot:3934189-Amphidinium_carterae.1